MYKVIILDSVRAKIKKYGDAYRDIFVTRFSDTGLWYAEELIQKQYLESADLLVESIYGSMEIYASRDLIPYRESGEIRETHTRLGSRRIDFCYEEDVETMTRYITDIEILRK